MRLSPFAFCFAFAALGTTPALAQTPTAIEVPPGALAQADVNFLQDANSANLTQIAMGHTAESAAVKPGLHSLAERIVSSHTKADEALQLLASRKHVDLPRHVMHEDHGELAALSDTERGGEFDSNYLRNVMEDHQRMIDMYEAARAESPDPDIRHYADVMLPALRRNYDQAVAFYRKQPGVSEND